ncbi:hypothetical protein [Epinotia aporema granulovirus]|uniref:Uncharacterized protein n=1 Tax=Epinotia aporema granulovirus TaxID=166056 RepID=K4ERT5_9BBAC|nr:hypothetical protein [Epinotia aporema granulovirus]AER41445.1 hypothetical protein [Epinotia aporema granulovirus]
MRFDSVDMVMRCTTIFIRAGFHTVKIYDKIATQLSMYGSIPVHNLVSQLSVYGSIPSMFMIRFCWVFFFLVFILSFFFLATRRVDLCETRYARQ